MMKTMLIHNPRCSKSREAKAILEKAGIDFEIIDYLKDGLKEKLLVHLPKLLALPFTEMIREKEEVYQELKLKGTDLSDKEWIDILIRHPILLERPIFIHGERAIIARPPELVNEFLGI
ncbi:MAG: arsenate reductase (glutaredoxin) [Bacteriovorax sp.]